MKRLFDVLLASVSILALSPVLLVTAMAIKVYDRGPILFKQKRVGINGVVFEIFKFRSMVVDADKIGGFQTSSSDNRITKIGKIIRKTSIDELPQLLNVLLGDMSLVGPRPNVPAQKSDYSEQDWNKRNSVKPGITGLAQALGRSDMTPELRTRLDLEYINNNSFREDLRIIYLTFMQVLTKGGN
ncbi:sugar transferase [Vibrio neptunius]|uniref:sugar transferase n=1 Tax=Vibrio neptunius TaxID=170651 RepID=UPI0019D0694D|nr:sugar transferase [Vibrio neptunius]MBN3575785.1 sugar transferase [Vibrio neptunius]